MALDTKSIRNTDGEVVFELKFFDPADGIFAPADENFPDGYNSTRIFLEAEKTAVIQAAQYWIDVLKPTDKMPGYEEGVEGSGQPLIINLGTINEENAWGDPLDPIASEQPNDPYPVHLSTALLANGTNVAPTMYGHGVMGIGVGWNTPQGTLTQTGRGTGDLTTIAIHEFGHILGISSPMEYSDFDMERWTYLANFPKELTRWQSHLRDNNGNLSTPGAYPNVDGKPVDYDSTGGKQYIFDMGDPNSSTQPAKFTFVGKNTLELWYGKSYAELSEEQKKNGVPLQGLIPNEYYLMGINEADRWVYAPENTLAHIDARNSVMSWQMYRNYPMFLEIELAVMQDMGYNIDRSSFYGKSFYGNGDGELVFNAAKFSSLSAYGIGLHLFGSNLNIVQTGNIQVGGAGAAGIRVDGVGNTLTIPYGTSIYAGLPEGYKLSSENQANIFRNYGVNVLANEKNDGNGNSIFEYYLPDGLDGTGLLVSYGKDHHIIHRGNIITAGEHGTAVRFDFGEPNVGVRLGSYAFDPNYGYMEEGTLTGGYPEDIQGPLVKTFDITGTIKGGVHGSGAPIVTEGSNDRIVTRGNDVRFQDSYNGDIFRVFEKDGTLYIPTRFPHFIQADNTRPVNESLSTLIVHPGDGSTVIIYEKANPQTPDLSHTYRVDSIFYGEDVYRPTINDTRDVNGNITKRNITLTHIVDGTRIYIEIENYDVNGNSGPITLSVDPIYESTTYRGYPPDPDNIARLEKDVYDPADPDITIIFTKGDIVQRANGGLDEGQDGKSDPAIVHTLLENYDIGYIDDRIFILRKLDDPDYDPNQPWTRYVAADQDDVFIPENGGAIYITDTAHVDTINVMNGANIEGDIISQYIDDQGRGTTLTFGLKPDSTGQATLQADSDFHFVFKNNISYYEFYERAYINDRPGYDDIARWGDADFDEGIGAYVSVGAGQGQYRYEAGDLFGLQKNHIGKIDLHFAGGHTEFRPENATMYHRYNVNSVLIDNKATFELSSVFNYDTTTGAFTISKKPEMYIIDSFVNNGRFSGEGDIWVGAEQILDGTFIDDFGTYSGDGIGFIANGTLVNRGIIAPGPDNGYGEFHYDENGKLIGRRTGTFAIAGNLDLSSRDSVYEVTISDGRETTATSPSWDPHPYWATDTVNGINSVTRRPVTEKLTLVTPDPNTSWGIDPATGLPMNDEREIIGGGWGVGSSDRLVVSGNTKLGGTLRIFVTPGDYSTEPTTYTIIQSENGYTPGTNFEQIEHYIGFLTFEPYDLNMSNTYVNPYDSRDLQFTVIRDADYFKKHGKTFNEIAVATAIDHSLFDSYRVAFSLGDNRNTTADLRNMYHQISAAIRANSMMINLWSPSEVLFPHIGWGNGQMETDKRGRVHWNRIAGKKAKMLGQSKPVRVGSLWGEFMNTTLNAESDGNSDEYRFNRSGFMIGNEWSLTPYSAIGAIMSYHNSSLKQVGDKVKSDDYILGTYFVAAPFNTLEFKAYLGLGFQEYDSDRRIFNANIITDRVPLGNGYGYTDVLRGVNDRYVGDTKGNSFNFSMELTRPLELHPTFILRPTLGIDVQHVWQSGYRENDFSEVSASYGSNIYALRYLKAHVNRGLLHTGFSSETSGHRGGIRMRVFYVSQIAGNHYPISTAAFATGGERFTVRGVNIGNSYLHLGVGANYWLDGEKTSAMFFDYDANIYNVSYKINTHMVNFGLLQKF